MKLTELRALFRRSVRALISEADTSEANPLIQYGDVISAIAASVFARLDLVRRDSVPSTATLDGALAWGAALQVPRKGPTQAHGKAVLQVRGTPGATIVHATALRAQTGGMLVYVQGDHVVGADGLAYADVRTEARGKAANLSAGTTLQFAIPPAGVQQNAKLVKSLQGGLDREPGGSYQERVARRLAEPPQGGNVGDYRRWIEDALPDELVTGFPLPNRNGRGTVDIVGLRITGGYERLLGQAERDTILDYILPLKLATDQVRVVETIGRVVDIEVALQPVSEPRYQFDFDDQGGLAIDSWNPTTRELVFTDPLPPGVAPNKRISLRMVDGGQRGNAGQEQRITALTGPSSVVLVDDPDRPIPATLGPGDHAFAGGPLVERARRAILDGYTVSCDDTEELDQHARIPGIHELGPANPNTRYGSWLDRIEPSRIAAAARAQAGVDDAQCVAPASAVVPIDMAADWFPPPGATSTIEVLLAGQVIVRQR